MTRCIIAKEAGKICIIISQVLKSEKYKQYTIFSGLTWYVKLKPILIKNANYLRLSHLEI